MSTMLAYLVLALQPMPVVVVDDCDLIDINHFYSTESGERVFTQVIYSDYDHASGLYVVIGWRMFSSPHMRPIHGVAIWHDAGTLRKVRARVVIETWSTYDREVANREIWPANLRRNLGVR